MCLPKIPPIYENGSVPIGLCVYHKFQRYTNVLTKTPNENYKEWYQCFYCGKKERMYNL